MVNPVEEFLQVNVHDNPPSGLHERLRRQDGIVCTPSRTEAVAVLTKSRIKNRLEDLQERLLDQTVQHRGDAKLALAAPWLRDHHISGSCPSARRFDPRFLPTVGHPSAVALHFARCDQLTVGLPPTRMRPCWAHNKKSRRLGQATGFRSIPTENLRRRSGRRSRYRRCAACWWHQVSRAARRPR